MAGWGPGQEALLLPTCRVPRLLLLEADPHSPCCLSCRSLDMELPGRRQLDASKRFSSLGALDLEQGGGPTPLAAGRPRLSSISPDPRGGDDGGSGDEGEEAVTVLYSRPEPGAPEGTPAPAPAPGTAGEGGGGDDGLAEELRRQLAQSARTMTRQPTIATPLKYGGDRDLLGRKQPEGGAPALGRAESVTPGPKAVPGSLTAALSRKAELQRSITRGASQSLAEGTEATEV